MTFLVDFGIKSGLVLGIAFLASFLLRRSSAAVRYALWTCAMAAVMVLPLAGLIGPVWRLAIPTQIQGRGPKGVAEAPGTSVVIHAQRTSAPPSTGSWALSIWAAGMIAMMARIAAGHWRVRSLFGSADRYGDPLTQETAARIGLRRAVILKHSTAVDVPLSYGLVRATIVLPGESRHWTQDRRRVVLIHEMIHARRFDSVWGLLAQCSLAVNWFHPLAWLAMREFRKEQERSCDDAVVSAGTMGAVYASHLVDLARSIAIPEPALGMAQRFDLEGRVAALLDPTRKRRAVSRKFCAAMFTAALALAIPLASLHAQAAKASVAGTVYDPSGAIVPGAAVSFKNLGGSNEEVARVNTGGRYQLSGFPAGEYLLKVTQPGFAAYQKTITLEAGTPATMDIRLAIGEVKETVEIVGKRPASSSPSSVAPRPMRVGGMVQPIKLISKVNPAYPADAQSEGVEGTVLLRAVVSKDGSLLHLMSISNGVDPRLVSAALAAVPLWRYQPALLNAEPVEVITTIAVSFRLN